MKFIPKSNLAKLLDALKADYDVFVPVKKNDQRFFKKYDGYSEDIVIGEVRTFEPLKAFFSPAREKVADNFDPGLPKSKNKPYAIVGVKACDLKGFKVQDYVFTENDYLDPFYKRLRENNLIISADCTTAIDTCFCLSLGIRPFPREDYDINLSLCRGGFLVETGSDKGKALVEKWAGLFSEAQDDLIKQRDAMRTDVAGRVEENIKAREVPDESKLKGVIEKRYESKIWEDEAKTCVECGSCNTICPTCHCFLLYDQKGEKGMARLRMWDSCMIKDFARVAGGANPRAKLWMRLRNRFEKKFDFFPKIRNINACTGCGRCISACPAKIDIRNVLKRLVKNV